MITTIAVNTIAAILGFSLGMWVEERHRRRVEAARIWRRPVR